MIGVTFYPGVLLVVAGFVLAAVGFVIGALMGAASDCDMEERGRRTVWSVVAAIHYPIDVMAAQQVCAGCRVSDPRGNVIDTPYPCTTVERCHASLLSGFGEIPPAMAAR